ncbi:hypothetical protein [Pantoea sp. BAV 3049]|uniref:hypothetical protein n=1 Tax=Pantoea sp. BAV 3049 TaxID=2654188 RepID=UPI00131C5A8D|nr:hypothetical protein [Pantoea sp. BAV 3049]
MKRFIVFAFYDDRGRGGYSDIFSSADDLDKAIDEAEKAKMAGSFDCIEIYDHEKEDLYQRQNLMVDRSWGNEIDNYEEVIHGADEK